MSTVMESAPSDSAAMLRAAIAPPQPDTRSFRREMTPTWLSAAVLLGGQRPPRLERSFRVAYLGSASGVTPAVIAAVHPDATIWAWDWRPRSVEAVRRLRDTAGLDNLLVHERPGLPPGLMGEAIDVVAVENVIDGVDEDVEEDLFDAIGECLRPGGIVALSYKTVVGWAEIAPVQRTVRHMVLRDGREPIAAVPDALDLLDRLQAGGAGYLAARPAVAAWLERVRSEDAAHVVAEYVERELRPTSHAHASHELSARGFSFVGSAQLMDDLGPGIAPNLASRIATLPTRTLREAYTDLAVRRASRTDVFRLGAAPLSPTQSAASLRALELAVLTPAGNDHGAGSLNGDVLGTDLDDALARLRHLLDSEQLHPIVPGGLSTDAMAAARSLNAALVDLPTARGGVLAAPLIGSAVPSIHADDELLERLGAL